LQYLHLLVRKISPLKILILQRMHD
jgi:hypothetical protein